MRTRTFLLYYSAEISVGGIAIYLIISNFDLFPPYLPIHTRQCHAFIAMNAYLIFISLLTFLGMRKWKVTKKRYFYLIAIYSILTVLFTSMLLTMYLYKKMDTWAYIYYPISFFVIFVIYNSYNRELFKEIWIKGEKIKRYQQPYAGYKNIKSIEDIIRRVWTFDWRNSTWEEEDEFRKQGQDEDDVGG